MIRSACRDEAESTAHRAVLGYGSTIVVPLVVDGHDVGSMSLSAHRTRPYDDGDRELAEQLGRRLATVVAAEAESVRQRHLQRVSALLAAATGEVEVARIVEDGLARSIGASAHSVFAVDSERGGLRRVDVPDDPDPLVRQYLFVLSDAAVPLADSARAGTSLWLPDRRAWHDRYRTSSRSTRPPATRQPRCFR